MRRLLIILLLVGPLQAGVLDDLESCRSAVTRRSHLATAGTDQFSTAEIDSVINETQQLIATRVDLDPVPYMKIDTIALVDGTYLYTLPGDFVEGGLKYCLRRTVLPTGGSRNVFVPVVVLGDLIAPKEGSAANQVFAEGGVLGVHPLPTGESSNDTLVIWYQALPSAMTLDTSSVMIIPKYREMLVLRTCWQVMVALGRGADAAEFARLYNIEDKRIVVPPQ